MTGIDSFFRCAASENIFRDAADRHSIRTEYPPFAACEYDRAESDFLCRVSHGLRTPINVIMSSVRLFEIMGDDLFLSSNRSKVNTCHQYIKQNCYRLLRLVNNLIDAAGFDSDQVSLNISNCDVVKTVDDIMKHAASFAQNKSIALTFHSKEQEVITAFDEDKIRRVILNLLSNSLKFTPAGGSVRVSLIKNETSVVIRVKDTGCGIPAKHLNNIFRRFSQTGNTLTRSHDGGGIGLPLSGSIVRLHLGTIYAKSKPGSGSIFIVELPLRIAETNNKAGEKGGELHLPLSEMVKIELSDI